MRVTCKSKNEGIATLSLICADTRKLVSSNTTVEMEVAIRIEGGEVERTKEGAQLAASFTSIPSMLSVVITQLRVSPLMRARSVASPHVTVDCVEGSAQQNEN